MKREFAILSFLFLSATPALPEPGAEQEPAEKTFKEACSALALKAEQDGTMTVPGNDGWMFLAPELRHVAAGRFWGERAGEINRPPSAEHADPLPAILDFNEQLKARGIELLFVPVPAKAVILPEGIPGALHTPAEAAPPRFDSAEQAFSEILRTNGIQVVDLVPLFTKNRGHERGPMYCKQDSHWSGNGCVLAAERIADEIRGRPWFADIPKRALTSEWISVSITGDLWKGADDDSIQKEELSLRRTGVPSESGIQAVEPEEASPIVLLGDSHTLVFHSGGDMHARWAGLPDQLALELGFPVDLVGVRGSGATPARINLLRRAQKNREYWTGKRMVVWCFSVREFTQSDGWRKVPVAP